MKNLAVIFLALLSFASCKKSNNNQTALSKETLAGDYKITSANADIGGSQTDIYNYYLTECKRDDIYSLKADGTYKITDAGITCTPLSTAAGNWSLSGNEISIGDMQFTVTDYNSSQIKGQTNYTYDTAGVNINANVNIVFTRQ